MPQALGGWALVLRYGSTIGPCEDRTALPDDIVASMGAGVALQARSYTAALRAEWAAGAGARAQRAAAVPTFTLRAEVPGAGAASDAAASCPVPGGVRRPSRAPRPHVEYRSAGNSGIRSILGSHPLRSGSCKCRSVSCALPVRLL